MMIIRRLLTAVAVFAAAVLGTFTLGVPTAQAASCDGVWVVVAGQGTKCATSHGTGKAALQSAGFSTKDKSPGFLCQINSSPSSCVISTEAYWSYWQAKKNADGSWGKWTYSNLGYTSTSPAKGSAEGWSFGNGSTPPPAPPKDAPKPPPAATTSAPAPSKPAPAPATSASKPAASKPATSQPAASQPGASKPAPASKVPAAPGKPPASQPAAPAASEPAAGEASTPGTGDGAPEASSTDAPIPEPTAEVLTSSVVPTPTAAPAGGGSPVGVAVTLGVVALGGGGLGAWWFLKRRP